MSDRLCGRLLQSQENEEEAALFSKIALLRPILRCNKAYLLPAARISNDARLIRVQSTTTTTTESISLHNKLASFFLICSLYYFFKYCLPLNLSSLSLSLFQLSK